MGNIANSAEKNDDLVDILKFLTYIQTEKSERVFRAVDRGDYVCEENRIVAYQDLSWRFGYLHLSAPSVYGKAMESLSLESGLSFLNLGSGTGYFSTMAGLILSHHGTNHGVEINEDCLNYSNVKLKEFKERSLALDEFDFCEPVFIHGNCLKLVPNRQYDRVYCGAACPESHEAFIKQFVKIGGILVMPYKGNLLRIERIDEDVWNHKIIIPVTFESLILPTDDNQNFLQLPSSQPLSLQQLSRCGIRNQLRKLLWQTHPELHTQEIIGINAKKICRSRYVEDNNSSKNIDYTCIKNSEIESSKTMKSVRTNEYNIESFETRYHDSIFEKPELDNCTVNVSTQFEGAAAFPSTSYHNDITNNKLSDNDNISSPAEENINSEVTCDQSSTINSVEENKFLQCSSYIDDIVQLGNGKYNSSNEEDYRTNSSKLGLPAYEFCIDDYPYDNATRLKMNESDNPNLILMPKYHRVFARNVNILFSTLMKGKIHKLPLPSSLLMYINYNRDS